MITRKVEDCARCGEDHRNVQFRHFKGKYISCDEMDFQYWGWCPTNLEPIILSVDDEEIPLDRESQEDTEKSEICPVCRRSPKCEDSELSLDEAK